VWLREQNIRVTPWLTLCVPFAELTSRLFLEGLLWIGGEPVMGDTSLNGLITDDCATLSSLLKFMASDR